MNTVVVNGKIVITNIRNRMIMYSKILQTHNNIIYICLIMLHVLLRYIIYAPTLLV